jgi:thiamine-monophosphate kinase
MARPELQSGEFGLIAKYFAPLAKDPGAFGLKDDAAILPKRPGYDLVVTKDAIVEGVHYLASDPLDTVAQKLLRVNVSDLAAKGAMPAGYLLMTAFAKHTQEKSVALFARGLARDQAVYGLSLWGGDTVATPGPPSFSCTMMGWVKAGRMLRRSGARPGDETWVTGTIGDSGEGLALLRAGAAANDPKTRALIKAYRIPNPPAAFGALLPGLASAAMDVSDGLIQDAGHMAAASGVALSLDFASIPLSLALLSRNRSGKDARLKACAAGDDYQILFAAAPKMAKAILAAAAHTKTRVTRIGAISKGRGVTVLSPSGEPIALSKRGYTHF